MNYRELPLRDRMNKAREYALLLAQDEIPVDDIPATLQELFALSPQQAEEAVATMKQVYRADYRAAGRRRAQFALTALLASVVITIFYYFLAQEIHPAFLLLPLLFAIGGLGALLQLVQVGDEHLAGGRLAHAFIERDQDGSTGLHWTAVSLLVALLFVGMMSYRLAAAPGILGPGSTWRLGDKVLQEAPVRGETGGKNSSYFYEFRLVTYPGRFRFHETYYEFARRTTLLANLAAGTPLDVEILMEDRSRLEDRDAYVNVVNLVVDGVPLYNVAERNAFLRDKQRREFRYSLAGLAAALLLCFWRYRTNV
ncbi:hypothetical protein [Flaviaesturariibacter amylovorans]|uniref:DUF3592 domain-containing protein n=1 Tax=Flaviaesturariibacter amylovorans TaxID=1084520 RepID=A0ABP8GE06_9BACT